MPYYSKLKRMVRKDTERGRAIENLLNLRIQLDSTVPAKDAEDNLLLATWNIRDFGKPVRKLRGWGPRLPESWFLPRS